MAKWLIDWIVSQEYHHCYFVGDCEVFSNKKYTIVIHPTRGLCLMYPFGYYDRFEPFMIEKELKQQE